MSTPELLKVKHTLHDLTLPEEVQRTLVEIAEDHEYEEALVANGLVPRKTILIHGPPGCGKTSVAHGLAALFKLPLYLVSCSNVVGSTLGTSEGNIDRMLKSAYLNTHVLLIDEFDSIATKRGDSEDGAGRTENRIVNTILTSFDNNRPRGLIVACTNLFERIDPAIKRRFDVILEVPLPPQSALLKIAEGILKDRFDISAKEIVMNCSTPSDVARECNRRLRLAIVEDEKKNRGKKEEIKRRERQKKIEQALNVPQVDKQPEPQMALRQL